MNAARVTRRGLLILPVAAAAGTALGLGAGPAAASGPARGLSNEQARALLLGTLLSQRQTDGNLAWNTNFTVVPALVAVTASGRVADTLTTPNRFVGNVPLDISYRGSLLVRDGRLTSGTVTGRTSTDAEITAADDGWQLAETGFQAIWRLELFRDAGTDHLAYTLDAVIPPKKVSLTQDGTQYRGTVEHRFNNESDVDTNGALSTYRTTARLAGRNVRHTVVFTMTVEVVPAPAGPPSRVMRNQRLVIDGRAYPDVTITGADLV